jgi:hypothetical protein
MSAPIKIDEEFRRHLLPLDTHELLFLEDSIVSEGCRESLVIWQEQGVLIDGHHRYDICTRLNLPYQTRLMSFSDRESVLDWMDNNQAGRRNMTTKDLEIVRGRIYNRRKKSSNDGGQGKSRSGVQVEPHLKTAETIAAELEVSPSTVKRSGKRAEVYDSMLELDDTEAAHAARSATREQIDEASKKPPKEAAEALKEKAKEKAEKKAEPRQGVPKRVPVSKQNESEDEVDGIPKSRGFGIERAHDAIACLKRIPKSDALRLRGFEIVMDWIKHNRREG